MTPAFIMLWLAACAANPIVLENGAVRVEVDPDLFSIQFIGLPGGRNFFEPVHISDVDHAGKDWLDPGGLVTDLVPLEQRDAAIRRGPAEVVARDDHSVVLLGPESPALHIRLKKELKLLGSEAKLRYIVTALGTSAETQKFALRNTARVPIPATLRVRRADATIRALSGAKAPGPAVVRSNVFWLIPVPPTQRFDKLVLGAESLEVGVQNNDGVLTRRIVSPNIDPKTAPYEATFVCILDDVTRSYGAALQSSVAEIDATTVLTLAEEWTIEKRGK
jgi:hypothetical protein